MTIPIIRFCISSLLKNKAIRTILTQYRSGLPEGLVFNGIHSRWDEFNPYHWCHTISNAEIVTAALLYGGNDYSKSICLAVQTGFDTDCNAATVGSILGIKNGLRAIPETWISPTRGKLATSIFGVGTISIEDLIQKTLEHVKL